MEYTWNINRICMECVQNSNGICIHGIQEHFCKGYQSIRELYMDNISLLCVLFSPSKENEKKRSYEDVARFCSIVPFTLLIRLGQSAFSCKHQYMENKGSTSSQIM